jgi:predicted NAD/FAD-dependent oxidoreductase
MDIAVVGAGIAGLCAGWTLRRAGHRVRVFERNYKPGGRMNTRRKAGLVVDHGDRFIHRDAPVLRELILDCGLQGDVCSIDLPIVTLGPDGVPVETPNQGINRNRISFPDGMLALPEALRRQLGGYYSIGVTAVDWNPQMRKFTLQTEPPLRPLESQVDGVVLATAATEALQIAQPMHPLLNPDFLQRALQVHYTGSFTLMAALRKVELPRPYFGLDVSQVSGSTISWIAFEDLKCERRGVSGWTIIVAHCRPEACAQYFRMEEEEALRRMYQEARRYIPQLPPEWRWARGKRWEIAHLQDEGLVVPTQQFPAAVDDILIEFCGDYREGDGCEAAARSGKLAAEKILAKIERLTGGAGMPV